MHWTERLRQALSRHVIFPPSLGANRRSRYRIVFDHIFPCLKTLGTGPVNSVAGGTDSQVGLVVAVPSQTSNDDRRSVRMGRAKTVGGQR